MRNLLALVLLTSCAPRLIVRVDYYPPVTLTKTVCKDGKMVNRPVTMEASYEITRWSYTPFKGRTQIP